MTNNSYGQNSPAYKEAVRRQAEALRLKILCCVSQCRHWQNPYADKQGAPTTAKWGITRYDFMCDLYQGRGCRNALQTVRKITEMGCV